MSIALERIFPLHLVDHFSAVIGGDLDQRHARDIADDVDAADTRLITIVYDRQDFLGRDRGEVAFLFRWHHFFLRFSRFSVSSHRVIPERLVSN